MPLQLKSLLIDEEKAIGGAWFNFELDARLKIARAGNTKWTEWLRKRAELGESDDMTDDNWAELLAAAGLTDWENVELEEGKPFPPTYENRLYALKNFPDLYDFVFTRTHQKRPFRIQARDEKN